MVAVKITAFGGMIPAQDDHLLPENNSASNQNTFLDAGSLQGMRQPAVLHTMANPSYKYAFRIPLAGADRTHIPASYWWELPDPDTNVIRSLVANDSFERYYAFSPSAVPQYNTKARILAGSSLYTLGIPTPETAPGVSVAGGSGVTEARSYVYTWVSAYGEEGPPSPPTVVTGFANGTWNIVLTAPLAGDTANRNLTKVRIYRTITANTGTAVYYRVVEQDIGTTTYADTVTNVTLAGNTILQSFDWGGPPSDLKGAVSMPNGMLVGWRANEIWFCEPYRPHAWPTAYTISIDANVVGLGVIGQTLIALTDGFPYAATGIHPSNMAMSKIEAHEPCASRASIVSTPQGVFYASPNGVILAAYGVVQNATQQLVTKDKWNDLTTPEGLRAGRFNANYYAWGTIVSGGFDTSAFDSGAFERFNFGSAFDGVMVNLVDPRIAWTNLFNSNATDNVMTDIWTGEIFVVRGGAVYWVKGTSDAYAGQYLWRSKIFQLASAQNLGAMKVWFEERVDDPMFSLNPVRNTASPQTLAADQYGLMRIFADGNLVMTREIRKSGELWKLPSGFKASNWQFEIEARAKVFSFEVASSAKELGGV